MGWLRASRAVAIAAALALAALAPTAAQAGAGPAAGAVPVAPGVAGAEAQPTADEVRAALQRALALHDAVTGQADTVARARAALASSAADAALALESYGQAAALRDLAAGEAARLDAGLARAVHAADDERAGVARWVRQTYMDGGSLGTTSPGLYSLLSGGTTDDAAASRDWVEHAGLSRARVLARLRTALDAQQDAADRARHAADLAEAAAAQAGAASRARDAVLAEHRARLADVEVLLAGARDAAAGADARASGLLRAWGGGRTAPGRVAATRTGQGATGQGLGVVESGDCQGQDTSGYANGRIPLTALCPLPAPAAGLLRADAARAFGQLSRAFQERFGGPICVTDAYRSYDDQVRVRAERGAWAAVPGHSNHGLGTAVDLCGGVEDFDSPAHAWLVVNAPLAGWFHPAWARRGGSLPEPWHWEFAAEGQ